MPLPHPLLTLTLTLTFTLTLTTLTAAELPHLEKRGPATQLIVDGQPFLVLGGELHNSSSTSRAYLDPVWPKLAAMNLNTVLAAVPWDVVEPAEGQFDFSLVDHLLADARAHDLRLILLWFGSWKNGFSHYAPEWVKRDTARFPRAITTAGTVEILSPLSEASAAADAAAFAALMRHLRSVDEAQRTVIMVQVENEVGLHGDSRDRSALADAAFAAPVPRELTDYLTTHRDNLLPELRALWQSTNFKSSGTWTDLFGPTPAADEAFMGWHYARYIDRIAAAGRAEYPLPLFVNAWIVQPKDKTPGDYPSGGPQSHMLDLWRAAAPHIDLLTPDIYLPNFVEICEKFTRSNNPLFIPEARGGPAGAAQAFTAIGRFRAIGYSPFGIDGRDRLANDDFIRDAYAILHQLAPLILKHQTNNTLSAALLDVSTSTSAEKIPLGDYLLQISPLADRRGAPAPTSRSYALVIATQPDEFIVAGAEVQVSFASSASDEIVGLALVEEGQFHHGQWQPGRRLNGDEIMISYDVPTLTAARQTGTGLRFAGPAPTLQRVKLYRYR